MSSNISSEIQRLPSTIIKIVLRDERGKQFARASLVLIMNEVNSRPYGLLEDVFVDEGRRGAGYATRLVERIVQLAKEEDCYKLIATSRHTRPAVHTLYQRLGFRDHGIEFRMDL